MKKTILVGLAVGVFGATVAFGSPRGAGVVGSPHDLSPETGGGQGSDTQQRICAYCHTPHHAATSTDPAAYLPLWAKDVSLDTKQFYTAYNSATINAVELGDDTQDKAVGPTRLCMSCHDGVVAPDQHYGAAGTGARLTSDGFSYSGVNGAGVGAGDAGLTNDHPVGFDYAAVAVGPETGVPTVGDVTGATTTQDPWIRNPNADYKNNAFGLKVADRLFVANGKAYMTCATCHDVHNRKNTYTGGLDDALAPNYLVLAPQSGSALCLSCHIK